MPIKNDGIASENETSCGLKVKNVIILMMLNKSIKNKNNLITQRDVGGN
jgi:hypothetical protein